MRLCSLAVSVVLIALPTEVSANEIRVAAAANVSTVIETLATHFEDATGRDVQVVLGSTGKLYAQIVNGAPFDIFLAADTRHPELLERDELAVPGSRFTYATGHLMLWSPHDGYVDPNGDILESGSFRYLAIAHPRLAPYGRAARQVLEALDLWGRLEGRVVRGENIAQAFQFVESGNAELGFVALSQLTRAGGLSIRGSIWKVPGELYTPIEQQAVLLEDSPAGRELIRFLQSDEARAIIRDHGYSTP